MLELIYTLYFIVQALFSLFVDYRVDYPFSNHSDDYPLLVYLWYSCLHQVPHGMFSGSYNFSLHLGQLFEIDICSSLYANRCDDMFLGYFVSFFQERLILLRLSIWITMLLHMSHIKVFNCCKSQVLYYVWFLLNKMLTQCD